MDFERRRKRRRQRSNKFLSEMVHTVLVAGGAAGIMVGIEDAEKKEGQGNKENYSGCSPPVKYLSAHTQRLALLRDPYGDYPSGTV